MMIKPVSNNVIPGCDNVSIVDVSYRSMVELVIT